MVPCSCQHIPQDAQEECSNPSLQQLPYAYCKQKVEAQAKADLIWEGVLT